MISFIFQKMEHPNIDKENDIALNLIKHIHEKEFINRDLSSLDRIIQTYFNLQNRDAKEEKEVIEFLFSYHFFYIFSCFL